MGVTVQISMDKYLRIVQFSIRFREFTGKWMTFPIIIILRIKNNFFKLFVGVEGKFHKEKRVFWIYGPPKECLTLGFKMVQFSNRLLYMVEKWMGSHII